MPWASCGASQADARTHITGWQATFPCPLKGRLSAQGISFLHRLAPGGELGLLQGRLPGQSPDPDGLVSHGRDLTGVVSEPGAAVFSVVAPSHQPPPAVSQRPELCPSNAFHLRGIDVKASWRVLQGASDLVCQCSGLCGMTKSGGAHSPERRVCYARLNTSQREGGSGLV